MREWLALFALAAAAGGTAIATARGCGTAASPGAATPFPALPAPLPRLGTVGDYPPADRTLVVEVEADGTLRTDGQRQTLPEFRRILRARADAAREIAPPRRSDLFVVLRLHRGLPWQAAQWLLQECSDPKVRVHRTLFAAIPEDGSEEGAVAAFLPCDVPSWSGRGAMPSLVVLLRPAGSAPAEDPEDLRAALAAHGVGPAGFPCSLEAAPSIPTGEVLEAFDAALRAGSPVVTFRGTVPMPRADLSEILAARPPPSGGVLYRIAGRPIAPATASPPGTAPPARVRGRLAGSFPPGTAPEEPKAKERR